MKLRPPNSQDLADEISQEVQNSLPSPNKFTMIVECVAKYQTTVKNDQKITKAACVKKSALEM